MNKVAAEAAACIENAHAGLYVAAQNLIEDVDIDLSELFLNSQVHYATIPFFNPNSCTRKNDSNFERGQNLQGQLAHVSCAESKNKVALVKFGGNRGNRSGKVRGKLRSRACNLLDQAFRRYAGDRLLTGGVDGQHDHGVSVYKCAAELFQKIKGAGIAMGLENDKRCACGRTRARRQGWRESRWDDGRSRQPR